MLSHFPIGNQTPEGPSQGTHSFGTIMVLSAHEASKKHFFIQLLSEQMGFNENTTVFKWLFENL